MATLGPAAQGGGCPPGSQPAGTSSYERTVSPASGAEPTKAISADQWVTAFASAGGVFLADPGKKAGATSTEAPTAPGKRKRVVSDPDATPVPRELRPFQKQGIKTLIEGSNVLVDSSGGSGKSLIYEAYLHVRSKLGKGWRGGKVLVIAPLTAINKGGHSKLTGLGYNSTEAPKLKTMRSRRVISILPSCHPNRQ